MKNNTIKDNFRKYSLALLSIISTVPGVFLGRIMADFSMVNVIIIIIIIIAMLYGIKTLYYYVKSQYAGNEWPKLVVLTGIIIPMIVGLLLSFVFYSGFLN